MIVLITAREKDSKEQSIKKEVMDAYTQIYFSANTPPETKAVHLVQYFSPLLYSHIDLH